MDSAIKTRSIARQAFTRIGNIFEGLLEAEERDAVNVETIWLQFKAKMNETERADHNIVELMLDDDSYSDYELEQHIEESEEFISRFYILYVKAKRYMPKLTCRRENIFMAEDIIESKIEAEEDEGKSENEVKPPVEPEPVKEEVPGVPKEEVPVTEEAEEKVFKYELQELGEDEVKIESEGIIELGEDISEAEEEILYPTDGMDEDIANIKKLAEEINEQVDKLVCETKQDTSKVTEKILQEVGDAVNACCWRMEKDCYRSDRESEHICSELCKEIYTLLEENKTKDQASKEKSKEPSVKMKDIQVLDCCKNIIDKIDQLFISTDSKDCKRGSCCSRRKRSKCERELKGVHIYFVEKGVHKENRKIRKYYLFSRKAKNNYFVVCICMTACV